MALKHEDARVFNINGRHWIEWDVRNDEFGAEGQLLFSFTENVWTLVLDGDMSEITVAPGRYDPNGNTEALFEHGIALFYARLHSQMIPARKELDRLEWIQRTIASAVVKAPSPDDTLPSPT